MLREEGVVAGVEHERRDADALEELAAGGARPVVVGVAKAVQRCGDQVIELVESARGADARGVEQAGEAIELGERLGLEGGEEVARIDEAVQASVERA